MARQEHTPEKFEAIANELLEASNTLKSLAELMRSHNMPFALIHGTTERVNNFETVFGKIIEYCVLFVTLG